MVFYRTCQNSLNIWNAEISVKILLVIFSILIIRTKSAKTANTLTHLQKCSNNVSENTWIVPSWLQAPFSEEKIQFLMISIRKDQDQGKDQYQYQNFSIGEQFFKFNMDFEVNGKFECSVPNEANIGSSFQKSTLVFNQNNTVESDGPNTTTTRDYSNSNYYIMPNGYFRAHFYSIPPDNYCISRINAEEVEITACFKVPSSFRDDSPEPKTIGNKIVLRKCCRVGEIVHLNLSHLEEPECLEAIGTQEWTPRIVQKIAGIFGDKFVGVSEPEKHQPYFYKRSMGCENWGFLTPNTDIKYASQISEFRILENGNLMARSDGNSFWDRPKNRIKEYIDHFCVDGLVNTRSWDIQENQYYDSKDPRNEIFVYCLDKDFKGHTNNVYEEMFFYMTIVSSFILLVVVVTYGLIWPSQNIHGWTNDSFSLSMLLNFVFYAIVHGLRLFDSSSQLIATSSTLCISIGVVQHFFELATFTWMTILNFDLYNTICSMKPSTANQSKRKQRFLSYCCFGFGIPTVVVSVSLALDMQFDLFDDGVHRPQYGYRACSLGKSARLYYYVLPTIILFTFNCIFAILTAKFLYDFKKGTKCLRDAKTNTRTRSENAKLFFKLFVLNGFSWIFEIISWLVVDEDTYAWYWAIFDSYNILQAIGLFWIFVCKREVKDQLCSKYESIDAIFKWMEETLKQARRITTGASNASASTS